MTSTAVVFILPVDLVFRQHDIDFYCGCVVLPVGLFREYVASTAVFFIIIIY
jgi:hypothetical protein